MKNYFSILLNLIVLSSFSQSTTFPGNYFFDTELQRLQVLDSTMQPLHCGLQPQLTIQHYVEERNNAFYISNRKWIGRKLLNEDLIELTYQEKQQKETRTFRLNISPLVDFRGGIDMADTSKEKVFQNTRGVIIRGSIDKSFEFESVFLENQSTLLYYQDQFAQSSKVIPGNGRWKKYKENGYDYAMSSGYILYRVNSHLNLQLGHGKHKSGYGYRSLLLSDNAFNYPYARITANFLKGKIQYTSLYAVLMNLTAGDVKTPKGTERLFQKKPAAFHHLSIHLHKTVQISFFQSLIWNKADSLNRLQLDAGYFNPIIFTNLALYGLQNNKNMMGGMEISIRPLKTIQIYGQLAIDETGGQKSISNKTGWQAGLKLFDAFRLKQLFLQFEYNTVRPFTYAATDAGQSYTHYAQAMAHPLGANFGEGIAMISYRYKRFFVQGKIHLIQQGLNLGANYGQDIFISDFNPALNAQSQLQGIESRTQIAEGKIGCLLNPKTNLNVHAGFLYRNQTISSGPSSRVVNYLFFGLSTSLFNTYWDF